MAERPSTDPVATQLANIQSRTGKTLAELAALVTASGLTRHGEIRDVLERELGMGHGDANLLIHHVLQSDGASAAAGKSDAVVLDEIYAGAKASLRSIHEAVMAAITRFGDFEIAPKKGYVSLRRKRQFAMLGPATSTRVEIGLNMKDVPATTRLEAQKPGGMCPYKVRLTTSAEVDAELVAWIRRAYDAAG